MYKHYGQEPDTPLAELMRHYSKKYGKRIEVVFEQLYNENPIYAKTITVLANGEPVARVIPGPYPVSEWRSLLENTLDAVLGED